MPLTLKSPAFPAGGSIPRKYTCDGQNISPPLEWSGVPANARSLLLVCDDPSNSDRVIQYWAAYNIPPDWTGLREGYGPETLENGFQQAINDLNKPGYAGPCPPRGEKAHAYHFRLVALRSVVTDAAPGATCDEIKRLAAPFEIAFVELIGFYGR